MAIVVGPFYRALDDDNELIPNAQLRIRVQGSATLATDVFDDAAMTVGHELENPTPADAAGWFPLVFAPSGQQYDIAILDEDGAVIREFLNQESLGSDSGNFERDFGTSRARIAGSPSNVTSYEGGPPSGDDIGGSVRVGGWDDTQAEAITLDGALTNTTGRFKENSKKLPGVVYTENQAFAAVSSLIIPLTNDPLGLRMWKLDIWDFLCTGLIRFQLSYDGGLSYKSGAADYFSSVAAAGNGVNNVSAATTTTYGMLTVSAAPSATFLGKFAIEIVTPNSGAAATIVDSRYSGHGVLGAANTPLIETSTAYGTGGYVRATHIKIITSAGTMTGVYRLMPQRGTGDA